MNMPKMILFDYGHTLLYEPEFDPLRGEEALFRYVSRNPDGITPAEANEYVQKLFLEMRGLRRQGFELHEHRFLRLAYESLGIEFSIPYAAMERVFWNASCPGKVMPGAREMLAEIRARGLRSGVISNIMYSGQALSERFACLLPEHRFEFILASSEYGVRKPNPLLFAAALKKARLDAKDVWFVGDNAQADVEGAAGAGLFPVWYEEDGALEPWSDRARVEPNCVHAHIRRWPELAHLLDEAK